MNRGWFSGLALKLTYGVALAIGLSTAGWFISEGWPRACYIAAPIIGSLLVAFGWIVTSENFIKHNKRDQVLKNLTDSGERNQTRWDLIYRYLPGANDTLPLPGETAAYPNANHELYKTTDTLLNDYDFLAFGAEEGVYDERLLRAAMQPDFSLLYFTAERYIKHIQDSQNDPEIWAPFCRLTKRWDSDSRKTSQRRDWALKRVIRLAWASGYAAGFAKSIIR